MRKYGSVHTKFWTHSSIQQISDQAKLLAMYLLSSSHTNMLGCFRVPVGYIAEDLKWSFETVLKAFDELSDINYLTYDAKHSWVFIHSFLKYNPIVNPNQGTSITKLFYGVPTQVKFISQLINCLIEHNEFLPEEFLDTLETLSQPFRNQDQEQNQDQKQNQELIMSGKPDDVPSNQSIFEKQNPEAKQNRKLFKTQALEILQFLNEKTGRGYRASDINLNLIIARLKSGFSVMDCRQVIAKKNREWKSDQKMSEYLRPATLFNPTKFEQYVGELVIPKEEAINGIN